MKHKGRVMSQSLKQHTIKNPISIEGVGLHSGKPVKLTLRPAEANTGIIFRRANFDGVKEVKLAFDAIVETPLCTKLVSKELTVQTIEHLLSALAGLEIDNIYVDLNSDEIPIMDGSSAPFVFIIEAAGIVEQEASRKFIKVNKTIRIEEGDKFVELKPFDHLQIKLNIDFPHPAIKATQEVIDFNFSKVGYTTSIARARTFGMANQVEQLHKQGLALGASLDNAIGLSEDGVLNPEGLRLKDEFVKHKLIDVIGDLYTLGPILGTYQGNKPSHALNHRLLKTLMQDLDAWTLIGA